MFVDREFLKIPRRRIGSYAHIHSLIEASIDFAPMDIRKWNGLCPTNLVSTLPSFRLVFSSALGQVPGIAVRAHVGAQIFWRGVGGNLMRGRGQGVALGVVFSFARHGAFGFVFHRRRLTLFQPA